MHLGKLTGNSLQAYIAADSVALVYGAGRFRRHTEGVAEQIIPDDSGSQPWGPALQALHDMVLARQWTGLPIDIAVSGEFVRFALVPGINLNLSSSQLQGLVYSRFARIIGESMNAWSIRYCAQDKSTVLAAAIRKPLQDGLEQVARECRLKLRSVAPLWSCAINHRHAQFTGQSGWLVLTEARTATFGLIEDGKWVSLRTRMLDPAQASTVSSLLERERRSVGSAQHEVSVVGDVPGKGVDLGADWHLRYPLPAAPQTMALPAACRAAAVAGC